MKRTTQKASASTRDNKVKKRSRVVAIRLYDEDIEIAEWLTKYANLALAATTGMRISYQKLRPVYDEILKATRKALDENPGDIKIRG